MAWRPAAAENMLDKSMMGMGVFIFLSVFEKKVTHMPRGLISVSDIGLRNSNQIKCATSMQQKRYSTGTVRCQYRCYLYSTSTVLSTVAISGVESSSYCIKHPPNKDCAKAATHRVDDVDHTRVLPQSSVLKKHTQKQYSYRFLRFKQQPRR